MRPIEKLLRRIPTKLCALLTVSAILMISGCMTSKGEGFAIYLTKDDIAPVQMPALSHVDIADRPILAMSDIVAYNAKTHEITLTEDAYERISKLKISVSGKSFVVCVDGRLIYWGAFWNPASSVPFDGVTIQTPVGFREGNVIELELGYPSPSFYKGKDPRSNAEAMKSLEQSSKLK